VLVVLLMSNPNKCVDKSEAIVAVFARVSLAAIASCEDDIDHLTYRDEVDAVFSSVFRPLYQFLRKFWILGPNIAISSRGSIPWQ